MAGEAASKEQSARCRPFSQANGSECIAAADELHVFAQINDFTVRDGFKKAEQIA
jgi:hypothetical protein